MEICFNGGIYKNTTQYSEYGTTYKSITTTEYTTVDNKGEFKIEADKMSAINTSYRISTTSHADVYEDGSLTDTVEFPFEYTVPEYTSSATYKKIGSDSIYFDSGSVMFIQSGSTTTSNPSGMKYSLNGNKLKFYTTYSETKTETQQGVQMTVKNDAVVTVNLEKK